MSFKQFQENWNPQYKQKRTITSVLILFDFKSFLLRFHCETNPLLFHYEFYAFCLLCVEAFFAYGCLLLKNALWSKHILNKIFTVTYDWFVILSKNQ